MQFNINFSRRLILFFCLSIFFYLVGSLVCGLVMHFKGETTTVLRITAVVQDILIFIIPSLATAVLITRLPAKFLELERKPSLILILLACIALIAAVPAMNAIVEWNKSIVLPESMAGIEQWMRNAESSAEMWFKTLLGNNHWTSLIVNILIVAVFAGFSEELFYRGTFQRLLTTGTCSKHTAVWIVAIIFSASHLQFFGFFGRLLIGAYCGYLMVWTRCLWVPVIVHVFNNTLYLLGVHFSEGSTQDDVNTFGSQSLAWIAVSVILTSGLLYLIWRRRQKDD